MGGRNWVGGGRCVGASRPVVRGDDDDDAYERYVNQKIRNVTESQNNFKVQTRGAFFDMIITKSSSEYSWTQSEKRKKAKSFSLSLSVIFAAAPLIITENLFFCEL